MERKMKGRDMLTFNKFAVVVAATLIWGLSAPGVQIPAGPYTNSFKGTASLYDLSGSYGDSLGGITVEYTINMDATGKFTGQGNGAIDGYGGYDMRANLPISGSGTVKSSKNVTRVCMTLKIKGTVTAEGTVVKVSETMKANMEIVPGSSQMAGTVSGSASASANGRSRSMRVPPTQTYLDLPAGEDGSWTLTSNLAPAGKKYTGTGTAVLARGRTLPFTMSGTYAAKSDISKLTLRGQQAMNILLVTAFQNAQIQVQGLKGKALGQSPHIP